MIRRSTLFFLGTGTLTLGLVAAAGVGCQSGGNTTGTGAAGGGAGTTSTGAMTTSTGTETTTNTTGTGTGGAGSGTGGSSSGTGGAAMVTTIHDITTGVLGPKVAVTVQGVVAMSHKFLVSQSKSTGSCLWGIFVSAPGLTETAANTGLLVVSYGTSATIADGGTKAFCPVPGPNGTGPAGDGIPDDAAPGDVLDITGKTDYFINKSCGTMTTDSTVAQYQISNVLPGGATKTGTAPVPTPHAFAAADIASFAAGTDMGFLNQWGGVKVRLPNVTSTPQVNGDAGTMGITDQYGNIVLSGSNLHVTDKIYYQGLLKKTDICHSGPVYANDMTTFTNIDGFVYLDFCTWDFLPGNRCVDFVPPSDDCAGNTCP